MTIRFRNYFREVFTVIPTIIIDLEEKSFILVWLFWGIKIDCYKEIKLDKQAEELVKRYEKGFYDGFKQAKFDIEMDKINEGEV